ncbi:MAG TPA: hypothetical protein VN066_09225 [Rhodocyclaceae bacterium]|nr:hypothetical protein [Rhodocyclaceae bacterium]
MKNGLWVLLLVLSACATIGQGNGDRYWMKPDDAYVGMDDAVSILHYANYVRGLTAAERDRETERQRVAYARDKSDFRRLQYAFALTTGEAGAGDRKLALQLIEPLQDGRHDSGLAALAALLSAQLNALVQAQQQGIQTGAQQGQKRIDELEKKLDAVKDIERSLLRREKGKL